MARQRLARVTQLQPPAFPPTMPTEPTPDDALADRASLSQRLWLDARFDEQRAEDVYLEYVQARRVSFQQAELPLLQAADCRFDSCDFAGAALPKAHLRRTELLGCRLVGAKLLDADLEDVLFVRCKADLARLWTARCKAVRFEHCSLREASFEGANLAGVVFHKCDLTRADFRNTKLKGTDLRGSTIEGLQISSGDLPGAIIDPQQAVQLIELFGVVVRSTEE